MMSEDKLLGSLRTEEDQQTMTERHWQSAEKRLWMASLFCGNCCLYGARTAMPLCAAALSTHMHWDKAQTGMVLSAFFWGYTMTQVLGGFLSDRVGGGKVMTLGAIGWGLLTFLTPLIITYSRGLSYSMLIIVSSRLLIGCFQGVHFPSVTSLLSRKIPPSERAIRFATVVAGAHTGTLLCGSLGSVLLHQYGWQAPFLLLGVMAIVWLVFVRLYTMRVSTKPGRVLSFKDLSSSLPANTPVPWLKLFSKPAFWSLLIGHLSHTYSFFIILSWLPTYFTDNFPEAKGWVFNVVPWVVAIPSALFSGWLGDTLIARGYSVTFVRKSMQTLCLLGSALFLVLLAFVKTYIQALVCMAFALLFCGFHNSGINVNPQDIAPKFSGSVFGLMNTAGAIPGFVGVYIVGYILHINNSWPLVFIQTAVVCVVGWIAFTLYGTGKQVI